ncbi:hypothetical protein F-VV10_0223 [Faustovirus]|nr:hypothetical protein F-VV10_0223 [Faustovirus]
MFRFIKSAVKSVANYIYQVATNNYSDNDLETSYQCPDSELIGLWSYSTSDDEWFDTHDDSEEFVVIPDKSCLQCGADIAGAPPHYTRCTDCYYAALISRVCKACGRVFQTTRGFNNNYCARRDCVGLKSITPLQRENARKKLATTGYSKKAVVWLTCRAKLDNVVIKHALNGGEQAIKVGKRTYYVDGYAEATNTVYEFYGDLYHGNPIIYSPDAVSTLPGNPTYGELYNRTIAREKDLRDAGYRVIVIWEHDYDNGGV